MTANFFFNLTWLIPLFPLAAFAIIVLWTNRNRLLSTWVAWIGIGLLCLALLRGHIAKIPEIRTLDSEVGP